jgi:uncharacterized protein
VCRASLRSLSGVPDTDPVAVPMEDRAPDAVRWGLGDALAGWVLAQLGAFVAGGIVLSATGEEYDDLSIGAIAVAQMGLWLGMFGVPWFAARSKGNGLVRDFGLRIKAIDVPVGVLAGAVSQFAMAIVYIPIFILFDLDADDLSAPARDMTDRASGALGTVLLVLVVGIGAPVFEEVFYRGLVQRSMIRRLGEWPGVIVTAIVFGAVHFQLLQFPSLAIFGAVLGVLTLKTGRLGPAIVAHMAFNLVAVATLVSS